MERPGILLGIAGILLVGAIVWYGWQWLFPGPREHSADELAQAALEAGSLDEQTAAAAELIARGWPALPQMRRVLRESTVAEVRATMIQGLGEQWDVDSMPAFLDGLDDPALIVRARSAAAVRRIECSETGYRPEDPSEKRGPAIKAFRDEWEKMRDSPMVKRAREKLKQERQNAQ